jgi:uncharacterized membrane protein
MKLIGGLVLVALWIVLAFVLKLPSGWVHAPLAAGAVLIGMGIADSSSLTLPSGGPKT